jgi:tetratricopeptide (TPR) repeat protein
MAYNKSKYVDAAQKLLNQGKVAQAIAEYQNILKYEPRDQVTLMTIGELYIRQGETFQAVEYFERLAQLFVGDGFLTKAIAVYKRIAKLAPEEIRPLEKLADLYVQQGVMSEARPLFLQLAEIHLKNNRQTEAITLLKKLLLAEPDNLRIQTRLADLYQAMGQPKDAVEAYVAAAQRSLARGDQAESEKLADKVLKIEPSNPDALTVKARSQSTQGNFAQAARLLEQVPGLEKGGEQAELLLDLYVKSSNWDEATALALRVFDADPKNFGLTQKIINSLLEADQGEDAMKIIERVRIPMIDAGEHETVGRLLSELATRMPNRAEPFEWLVDTYGRTSNSFHLADAIARLGDFYVAAGQLERAKQTFEQLVERDPESESAKRKLNGVLRKLGLLPPDSAAEEPHEEESLSADILKPEAHRIPLRGDQDEAEPQAKTPVVSNEPALDDETRQFIAQSLTDVDLFASYGLTQKAIGLLEAILRRAPRHTPTLEKLLDFVLGAGDDRRTAELAARLEQIHNERGDDRNAERFGELRRRFQRAAGLSDEDIAAVLPPPPAPPEVAAKPVTPEVSAKPVAPEVSSAPAAPPPAEKVSTPEPVEVAATPASAEVHEVDLSDEWASLLEEARPAPPAESKPARQGEPSVAPPAKAPSVTEFEIPVEAPATEEVAQSSTEIPVAPVASVTPETPAAKPQKPAPPQPQDTEFDLEQELELVVEAEPLVPAHEQRPPVPAGKNAIQAPPAETGFAADAFLADLANEIDRLGLDELAPAHSKSAPAAPPSPAKAPAPPVSQQKPAPKAPTPAESGPLKEVFDEFRAELGEMGVEDEDLETHYNLGIAFREMGLLEEAISEFQKVAKATDNGKPFRYTMQCSTLLGLAFMEKGQPGIAALWYERALQTPGMDSESILALRYDLGVAQESAGEPEAALKSFSQVYAANIDYRDVAERIAALQKPAR